MAMEFAEEMEVAESSTQELVEAKPQGINQLEGLTFAERLEIAKIATSFESLWEKTKGGDVVIEVDKMLVQDCEQVDPQTGEVTAKKRTYFHDAKSGVAYASTSDAVYASALPIMQVMGPWQNWESAITITFFRALSRGGNEYLALRID